MAENKDAKTTPKKTVRKNASDSKKITPVTKKAPKKPAPLITSNNTEEKSFLVNTAENIETGAKIVGEKTTEIASDLAQKTSQAAGTIFEKVKKGLTEVYEAGSKVVVGATEAAQDYTEKYKHKVEVKELIKEQHALYIELGSVIYEKNKSGEMPFTQLFKEKDVKKLLQTIKTKENEIVKLGQELDESEK